MLKGIRKAKIKRIGLIYLFFMALLTAIAGEVNVIPFNGEVFRFGLGAIVFFLLLLIRPPKSLIHAGFITGLTVVAFRCLSDWFVQTGTPIEILKDHSPTFLFYFIFAYGLHRINIRKHQMCPLQLGALAAGAEFIGNGAENITRSLLVTDFTLTIQDWVILAGVALLRSYFVVGLYSSIIISAQKKQMQEMLNIGSGLYAETLYLQKSMNHIEQITASSFDLYRKLKEENRPKLSVQALQIAQEVHEVKKDAQRIYAGLSKITQEEGKKHFLLSELLAYVISANEKYSGLLKKEVSFHLDLVDEFETSQQIAILALLNNVVANAVESIEQTGTVSIKVEKDLRNIIFMIEDTGKGILAEDMPIVFEPGYTTKYNDQGVAATGIGLSHVQEILRTLEGEIRLLPVEKGSLFQIKIPMANIRE